MAIRGESAGRQSAAPPGARRTSPLPVAQIVLVTSQTRKGGLLMKARIRDSRRSDGGAPAASARSSKAERGDRESRALRGKALRKDCPRSSHAGVVLGQPGRDPLALIEQSNKDRVESLLPIRFTRMAESAF